MQDNVLEINFMIKKFNRLNVSKEIFESKLSTNPNFSTIPLNAA